MIECLTNLILLVMIEVVMLVFDNGDAGCWMALIKAIIVA